MDGGLQLFAYVSTARIAGDALQAELEDIVSTAKRNNLQHGITGALFHLNGLFMQVIEGPPPQVQQLVKNIRRDNRHEHLSVLIDEPVQERGFASWNMDCFNLSPAMHVDRQKLMDIAADYRSHLLARSDAFITFYRALLERERAA